MSNTNANILNEICARKAEHIAAKKAETSLAELQSRLADVSAPRGFANALKTHPAPAIIAEVKKASPSKGIIRADFNPVEIAKTYEQSGAACLSVLTDEPYFQGHDQYLIDVKAAISLPVLRKDFMIEPYQIYESRALGADCILLIMAALDDSLAADMHNLAVDLGMDVLVEVHDAEELERAKALSPHMIGVNNRNLKTLNVSIQTSHDLADKIPDNVIKIAESGLATSNDIHSLKDSGYHGFLIGESLMRQPCIATAFAIMLQSD